MLKEYINLYIECDNKYNSLIYNAIEFICSEKKVEEQTLDCKLIFAENYEKAYKQYHYKPQKNENPNGCFIPIYFQNKETKKENKDIILINIEKMEKVNASNFFISSVIIHEFNHYLVDKEIYPILMKKYNLNLDSESLKTNKKLNYIGGVYQSYSEMHSKYYQEKYILTKGCKKDLDKYIMNWKENITKIKNEQDFYSMSYVIGQIKCWEYLTNDIESLKFIVNEIKRYYFNKYESIREWIYDAFDIENFLATCEKIYTDE